jgi:putative ABC transport system permease protein
VRNTTIIGSSPEYAKISSQPVMVGRPINPDDLQHRRGVAVIGSYVAKTLFAEEAPIGKDLDLGGRRVQVVGVAEEKGAMLGQSQDNFILVPHTFFDKCFSKPKGMIERLYFTYSIDVLPATGRTEAALDEIRDLMRRRRGLPYDKPDDFSLDTTGSLLTLYQNVTRVGFVAIVAIAAISLIVGGIGIMNIMLASVAERTREIGIRKAVGASNRDILWQFLIESVALSLLGGALGIVLGVGLAGLVSLVSPLKAAVAPWVVGLGVGFSACVGIFFGIYPARRAASLNPIEALRYEEPVFLGSFG